ncbi:hypothetical protein D3C80_1850650 [compost metagenome]
MSMNTERVLPAPSASNGSPAASASFFTTFTAPSGSSTSTALEKAPRLRDLSSWKSFS